MIILLLFACASFSFPFDLYDRGFSDLGNMDLLTLGHRFLTALPSTNTTNDFSDLPIKLIEAIVPGYSLFTNVIQQ